MRLPLWETVYSWLAEYQHSIRFGRELFAVIADNSMLTWSSLILSIDHRRYDIYSCKSDA